MKITFTEEVQLSGSTISVLAPGGKEVNSGPVGFDGSDRKTLVVPLTSRLSNGLYTVKWVSVSDQDGDKEEGAFNFGVRTAPLRRSYSSIDPQLMSANRSRLAGRAKSPTAASSFQPVTTTNLLMPAKQMLTVASPRVCNFRRTCPMANK